MERSRHRMTIEPKPNGDSDSDSFCAVEPDVT